MTTRGDDAVGNHVVDGVRHERPLYMRLVIECRAQCFTFPARRRTDQRSQLQSNKIKPCILNDRPRRLLADVKRLLIALLLVSAGYSQYPGQYPAGQYPPGTYPPGTYPPGGYPSGGIPIPRKQKSNKTTTDGQKPADQAKVFKGTVREVKDKSIDVEATDERVITFQIAEGIKKPEDLVPGDEVELEATQDDKGLYTAVSIKRTKAAPPAPTEEGERPRQLPPEEVEERPSIRSLGLGADEESVAPKNSRTPQTIASAARADRPTVRREPAPPPIDPRAAFIEKATDATAEFLSSLPNYVVQQFTTRYVSVGHVSNWQAQDVVSAEVIYEDHKERYQNLQINGKPVKTSIEDTGAWSTGEFGTVLGNLFWPGTATAFKYVGERTIARQSALLYDFDVDHAHSHWRIQVPSQAIQPAYHGSVWIEKDNARVLRIEMQAVKIPAEFPDDTTEMAIDYDYTSLGTERFLLPIKAEILDCQRGTNMCQRNTIEFRNYHRYTGESTITFH